jgi:hypothetical protein
MDTRHVAYRTIYAGFALTLAVLIVSVCLSATNRALSQDVDNPRIGPVLQISCQVVKTAAEDPFFPTEPNAHDHVFVGNTSISMTSTFESLLAANSTSCSKPSATSSYWFPKVRDAAGEQPVAKVSVYYRNLGGDTPNLIPDGLKIIGRDTTRTLSGEGNVDYRCGSGKPTERVPYGCTQNFRIRVSLPNCWDRTSTELGHTTYVTSGNCPESHPYKLPDIAVAIHYRNPDGNLQSPLQVSAGAGAWKDASFMHADRWDADQPEFDALIQKCVIETGQQEPTPPECLPGGGTS